MASTRRPIFPGHLRGQAYQRDMGLSAGGFGGDGGPATEADLHLPASITVDGSGNLFIADTGNFRIRRVDAATGP